MSDRRIPTIEETRRAVMIDHILEGVSVNYKTMAREYWNGKPTDYIERAYKELESRAATVERDRTRLASLRADERTIGSYIEAKKTEKPLTFVGLEDSLIPKEIKLTTFGEYDYPITKLLKKEDEMPNAISVTIRVTNSFEGQGEVIDGQYPAGATTIKNPRLKTYDDGDLLDVTLMVGRGEVKWGDVQLRESSSVPVVPQKSDHGWKKIGTEMFSPPEILLFETAVKELENRPLFVLQAVGDSGYGKTSRFHAWAQHMAMECLDIHCPTMRDPAEWFGYEEVGPKGTFFSESAFSALIQRGNGVAILDEITRVNPLIANSLLSVLDFRRSVRVHGRVITMGDHLLVGMTANKGLGYTATYEMDAALMRRVDATFEVGPPPPSVEESIVMEKTGIDAETASTLVSLLNKLRDANQDESKALHDDTNALQINTGSALKIGMLVRGGMNLRQAVEFVSINTAPIDLRRELTTQVNSTLGKTFRAF